MKSSNSGWEKLLQICLKSTDKQSLSTLLIALLTPEEYENIAKRMLILEALMKKELSQREIAKQYNVSIAKITRGSNELKRMPDSLKKQLATLIGLTQNP
ncbi:MAG: trp operon repressor [Legionellales bacterium]|nr:trp operon repressor [Legionellales bacterium]|tara:strand:- start:359 stop:658 length:300 start_codon:yes stop_codon:yes gene_type:complete